jgi:hypothetical protein
MNLATLVPPTARGNKKITFSRRFCAWWHRWNTHSAVENITPQSASISMTTHPMNLIKWHNFGSL